MSTVEPGSSFAYETWQKPCNKQEDLLLANLPQGDENSAQQAKFNQVALGMSQKQC